jgi:ABC-type sugar transport system ATPase subunit
VPAGSLSGGNQQKVVIGKSLLAGTRILLLDEPTRGIDAAVKHEIYTLIGSLADQGWAVLMVSSEMPEVLGLADRVIVLRGGIVAGTLTAEQANERNILELAMLDGAAATDPSGSAPRGEYSEGSTR